MVYDLGIYNDTDLGMWSHVHQTVTRCFAVLRQLRNIRRSVPTSIFETLVVTLVLSKLNYGYIGWPSCQLNQSLQSVLNAAAQSIAGLCRSAHITDTLASLHWLCAAKRIKFKLAVNVYQALHGIVPWYLSDQLSRTAD